MVDVCRWTMTSWSAGHEVWGCPAETFSRVAEALFRPAARKRKGELMPPAEQGGTTRAIQFPALYSEVIEFCGLTLRFDVDLLSTRLSNPTRTRRGAQRANSWRSASCKVVHGCA